MHFSIGFVAHAGPRRPVVSVCGLLRDVQRIDGFWPRDDGMICGSGDQCVKPGFICAPQGDDALVVFSVYDTDGDEFDLTGATEIVFAVSDHKKGTVRIVKRMSEGDIQISTNSFQFAVTLTDDDTILPVYEKNYYEVQVTTGAGLKKTVSAGRYSADHTMIKDIA